jgi:hypothetical protein
VRAQIDLFLLGLARVASGLWFRKVQIVGKERLPEDGPVLVVASHFNGLLDPALVVLASPRMPRFLAKAALLEATRSPAGSSTSWGPARPARLEGSTAANRRVFEALLPRRSPTGR